MYIIAAVVAVIIIYFIASRSRKQESELSQEKNSAPSSTVTQGDVYATMETNFGDIKFKLSEYVPYKTTENCN